MKNMLGFLCMLEDLEKTVSNLSNRLEKTEEALARLGQNVEETHSDIEKLELVKIMTEKFNRQMSFATKRILLELKNNHVCLIVPLPEEQDRQVELIVTNMTESFETIERRLEDQFKAIAFYHYFFIETKFSRLLEFSTAMSDDVISSVKFRLENDDEIFAELIDGGNIRFSYIKPLSIDGSETIVIAKNMPIQFEFSILNIIDDYDEYHVKAVASAECRLNDVEDMIVRLREKIEKNDQFKRLSCQSEN